MVGSESEENRGTNDIRRERVRKEEGDEEEGGSDSGGEDASETQARVAVGRKSPKMPTELEKEEHNRTHIPYIECGASTAS